MICAMITRDRSYKVLAPRGRISNDMIGSDRYFHAPVQCARNAEQVLTGVVILRIPKLR